MMGGGRRKFMNSSTPDPEVYNWPGYGEYGYEWWKNGSTQFGQRKTGDLINQWLNDAPNRKYVWNRDQLMNLTNGNFQNTDQLMGKFLIFFVSCE